MVSYKLHEFGKHICATKIYRKNTIKNDSSMIEKDNIINDDSIIFDCGANVGAYIDAFRKYSNPTIYAYEPNKELYKLLRYKYNDINKIHIINKAISSKVGEEMFYLDIGDNEGSSLESSKSSVSDNGYMVDTTTIDNEMDKLYLDRIDVLKLNIEGSEIKVLDSIKMKTLNNILQIPTAFHIGKGIYPDSEKGRISNYMEEQKFKLVKYHWMKHVLFINEKLI